MCVVRVVFRNSLLRLQKRRKEPGVKTGGYATFFSRFGVFATDVQKSYYEFFSFTLHALLCYLRPKLISFVSSVPNLSLRNKVSFFKSFKTNKQINKKRVEILKTLHNLFG